MPHTPEHNPPPVDTSSFTEEQQILFNRAAGLAPEETRITSTGAITSESLETTDIPSFTEPDLGPDPDISGIDTDLPDFETPQADRAEGLLGDIESILGITGDPETGVEATRRAERETLGVSALRTTQEDLASEIEALKAQSDRLKLQSALAGERVQQESLGRGRTVGGVRPLTAAAQRNLTLQRADIASQALLAQSRFVAVQGQLSTAQRLVDEAVQAKFGPLLAQKDALIENLDLLVKSGVLTREETRRAEAQKAKQQQARDKIKAEADFRKELNKLLLEVAPTIQNLPNAASIMRELSESESIEEAIEIATKHGGFADIASKLREQLLEIQLTTAKLELTKAQRIANNAVAPGVLQGLSDDQRSAYFKLVDNYDNNSKEFFKVRDAFTRIQASADDPSAAGDVAVVFNFMKMLDPGSVVRESEFALAASTGSLKDAMKNKFGKFATGEILTFTRSDFVNRAQKLFDAALVNQRQLNNTFEDRASKFGIPSGNVTRDIDIANRPSAFAGLEGDDLDEIDDILGINEETGLFEESALFNLFPTLEVGQ